MAPGPVPYIDGEGGKPNYPPYGEDFFQRIVGVHWREPTVGLGVIAIFIFGMAENRLGHVAFKDKTPVFGYIELPEPPLSFSPDYGGPLFSISGSSYAVIGTTPVFLVCGTRSIPHDVDDGVGNMTGVIDYFSVIYASINGVTWNKVFEQSGITDSLDNINYATAVALVWNPVHKLFYFDMTRGHDDSHLPANSYLFEDVYASPDGSSWGKISSTDASSDSYVSNFPSYCIYNVCIDSLGQNVPDGVAWQAVNIEDEEVNIAAAVAPVVPPGIFYGRGIGFVNDPSDEVIITRPKQLGSIISSVPDMRHILGVASAGRIIMAGGESSLSDPTVATGTVAYTWDGGTSWATLGSFPTAISTLIVGYVKRSINLPF